MASSVDNLEEGYDKSRFEVSVRPDLLCGICRDVPKDPRLCLNHHLFCFAHISKHLQTSPSCPVCIVQLTPETLRTPTGFLKTFLGEQKINCNYSKRGCLTYVRLENLQTHVDQCGFAPMTCANAGCEMVINRKDQDIHERNNCQFTITKCHDCSDIKESQEQNKAKLDEMKVKLNDTKVHIAEIEKKQDEILEKIDPIKVTVDGMKTSQDQMNETVNAITVTVDGMKTSQLDQMNKTVNAITVTVDEMKHSQTEMKTSQNEIERSQDQMNKKVNEIMVTVDEMKQSQTETKASQNEIKRNQDQINEKVNKMTKNDEMKQAQVEVKANQNEMKRKQDQLEDKVDQVKGNIDELKQTQAEVKETQNKIERKQHQIQEKVDQIKKNIDELKQTQAEVKVNKNKMKKEPNRVEDKVDLMKDSVDKMKEAQNEIKADHVALKAEMRQQFEQMKDIMKQILLRSTSNNIHGAQAIDPADVVHSVNSQGIIIFGGYSGEGHDKALNSVETFSIFGLNSIQLPPMNHSRAQSASCVYKNNVIVAGGHDGKVGTDTIEILKMNQNPCQWKIFDGKLPAKLSGHSMIVYGETLIVIGGSNASEKKTSDSVLELRLTPPYESKILVEMPEPRRYHRTELVNDKLYILGGTRSTYGRDAIDSVLVYDFLTNKCKPCASLPRAVCAMSTVTWGNMIIVAGGVDKKKEILNDVIMYNTVSGRSEKLPSMIYKRRGCSAVIVDDVIFVLGGYNKEQGHLKSAEMFRMGNDGWKELPLAMKEERYHATAVVKPHN